MRRKSEHGSRSNLDAINCTTGLDYHLDTKKNKCGFPHVLIGRGLCSTSALVNHLFLLCEVSCFSSNYI